MNKLFTKRAFLYISTLITTIIYLIWRGLYTLPWEESLFAIIFGIALWGAEIVSNFTAIILIWSKNKAENIVKPEIDDDSLYPDIDVLIATHNEDVDILVKTLNGVVNMDYPQKDKVHVYISDDTARPEVKVLADEFGVGYIGLADNKHAKSGNFNNALSKTNSPLVATFDADMIPYSNFLLETVPYFIDNQIQRAKDDSVKPLGLVQTPQSFYNADLFQFNLFSETHIPNEQDFFSRELNVYNNVHEAAIYTGSNTVIARAAIEAAGGFPTDTITEDFELGALINMEGYKNISTLEPLASGLTPTDVPSVLKQRIRWGRGVVQSVHNLNLIFNRKLNFRQKLVYLNSYLYWWSFLRRLLFIFAPILYTAFDIKVVNTDFWFLLVFWLPSYFLMHNVMTDISSDLRTQRWGEIQETIFAPFLVLPVLFQAIGLKETKFKVTNKGSTQSRRDKLYVIPHAIMLILAVYGLVRFNYGKFGIEIFYGSVISFWLLSHILNLTFSCLYYLGRPIYRQAERFRMTLPVVLQVEDKSYEFRTEDVSETGLSFVSDYPYYFSPDETLTFTVSKKDSKARFEGKIVRVWYRSDGYHYGVVLSTMDEYNYLQYLQVIYDGFNQSLRQDMDPMITLIDSFVMNIERREQARRQGPHFSQKYPMIKVNKEIIVNNISYFVHSFNYHELELTASTRSLPPIDLELTMDKISFQLKFSKLTQKGTAIYEVVNIVDLVDNPALIDLVNDWMQKELTV